MNVRSPAVSHQAQSGHCAVHQIQHDRESGKMKRLFGIVIWLGIAPAWRRSVSQDRFRSRRAAQCDVVCVAAVCCYWWRTGSIPLLSPPKFSRSMTHALLPPSATDDGRDFVPTNKWVLLRPPFRRYRRPWPASRSKLLPRNSATARHALAIAGAAFAGCVQDFIILFCSIRRDGKSLGQMAREEVSERGGFIAQLAVLANHDDSSRGHRPSRRERPEVVTVGHFYIGLTIPIAILLGLYLRFVRPGPRPGSFVMGVALVLFVVVAGQWVADSSLLVSRVHPKRCGARLRHHCVRLRGVCLAVWLLLAPRDYLSAFIKAGAIFSTCGRHPVCPATSLDAAEHSLYRRHQVRSLPERFSPFVSLPLRAARLADFTR